MGRRSFLLCFQMFYQMNSLMLANELIQYIRNTSIATAVIDNCAIRWPLSINVYGLETL